MTTLTLLPAVLDINAYRGDSLSFDAILKNADNSPFVTSGYAAASKIKNSANVEVGVFTCTISDNTITLFISSSNMSSIAAGEYSYDLELTKTGGIKKTFLRGTITIFEDEA